MTRAFADLGRDNPLRFAFSNRPPWADGLLVRRLLAAALVVVAAVLFVRGNPSTERVPVVVATHDLAPGHLIKPDDLQIVAHESGTLPTGAATDAETLVGATLTGAMRPGEIFTDLRIIGPRLAGVATGSDNARIVPIRLADTAVADILRAGDRVDVIGGGEARATGAHRARTLATDAVVVLVAGPNDQPGGGDRVVLVAMDAEPATTVAAASLHTALTVVFH